MWYLFFYYYYWYYFTKIHFLVNKREKYTYQLVVRTSTHDIKTDQLHQVEYMAIFKMSK